MEAREDFVKIITPLLWPDWETVPEEIKALFMSNIIHPVVVAAGGATLGVQNTDIVPISKNDVHADSQGDAYTEYADFAYTSQRVDVYSEDFGLDIQLKNEAGVAIEALWCPKGHFCIFDIEASAFRVKCHDAGETTDYQVICWA